MGVFLHFSSQKKSTAQAHYVSSQKKLSSCALFKPKKKHFSSAKQSALTEFTSRGGVASIEAQLAILETEGFTRIEALRAIGLRRRGGALASLEAQGFTGEGGALSALTELARRGGEAKSAIYRKAGNCIVEGCKKAILSGEFCKEHQPNKPIVEKSDKCRSCGRVIGVNDRVVGGVCYSCYYKPEAVATRKKAAAKKKSGTRNMLHTGLWSRQN